MSIFFIIIIIYYVWFFSFIVSVTYNYELNVESIYGNWNW